MTRIETQLTKAGIKAANIEIRTNEVEIYVEDNYKATERLQKQVAKVLGWGGFKTGYGAWVLRKNYVSNTVAFNNID